MFWCPLGESNWPLIPDNQQLHQDLVSLASCFVSMCRGLDGEKRFLINNQRVAIEKFQTSKDYVPGLSVS